MRTGAVTLGVLAVLLITACTSYRGFREAQLAEASGDWDKAVIQYLELVAQHPGELRFRAALLRAKIQASNAHFEQAKKYREAGVLEQALVELQQSVQLDPTNQYARAELQAVREELELRRAGREPETLEQMKQRTEGALAQPPVLNPRSPEPIDLDFPEPVSVKQIYQALGKAFGINILFDPSLRDQAIPIQLRDVTAQDALEILMRTAGHFYKVLDEHSIIVVADTPQNRRKYEDLIIQTFFLSNAEVKDVMTMLRSLVDSRKIAGNEQLNAIILRDTADKVKVAERIIKANDKSKAEVVVDVELMQLNTNKLQDLGLSLDSYQLGVRLDTGGEDIPLRFNDLEFLNANNWVLTVPNLLFDFIKNSTDAQTLARPQLRISEGERARLNIGDRVPIPVTSFNTANTVGSNVVPITSFQYTDVGILIEIEPRVHHNNEVSLQLTVEVSNISGNIDNQPIIGTRRIETTIRLKDGETNFLAGLVRTDETNSEEGVPGLSEIPILGRLFGKRRTQNQRTDIVLTLTPHIIRRANITQEDLMPIWVGTEQNITFRGGSPRVESDIEGPFDGDEDALDPAERVRQRLQQLPRGLQGDAQNQQPINPELLGGEEQQQEENEPPRGQELVPPSVRPDPVRRPPAQRPPPELSRLERGSSGPAGIFAAPLRGGAAVAAVTTLALQESSSSGPLGVRGGGDPRRDAERGERAPIGAPPEVQLDVVPPRLSVEVGDRFEISVHLQAPADVAHLPSRIAFDSTLIAYEGVRAGELLSSSGDHRLLARADETGLLLFGASLLGDRNAMRGEGTVATLTFRAIGPGSSKVRLFESTAFGPDLESRRAEIVRRATEVVIVPGIEPPDPDKDPATVPGRETHESTLDAAAAAAAQRPTGAEPP